MLTRTKTSRLPTVSRANSDPSESERRSSVLFGRIFFDEPGSHFVGKCFRAIALGFALTITTPLVAPSALGFVSAAQAQEPSQFKSILSAHGAFQAHAKYGEVWVPARTTVPEGWHPYPSCNWVFSKDLGWYFDDKTPWGSIVHHYGRWAHDRDLGWVWVKGGEFSPGWVVWRTSDTWVGWAPMPPEQDIREISATEFNTDKHWTFMDSKTFGRQCGGSTIVSTPPATIFLETRLVTEVKFVSGIAVFVLPPPLVINIVDIDIGIVQPWNPCFFGAWFWNWNMLINNVIININVAGPQCDALLVKKAPIIPIVSRPPPAPPNGSGPKSPDIRTPDRRTDLTPPRFDPQPPRKPIDPGFTRPRPLSPPVVVIPDRPKSPPFVKPDRPRLPPVADLPKRPDGRGSAGDKPREPKRPLVRQIATNPDGVGLASRVRQR